MGEIEPLFRISSEERTPTVDPAIAPTGFRFANRRGRLDSDQERQNRQRHPESPDDEVVLSVIAQVSLLDEEGKSVADIAADLGLPSEVVVTDMRIAAEISHPPEAQVQLGQMRASSGGNRS
jgi:hypothetical protein